jgi:hypothetical protein
VEEDEFVDWQIEQEKALTLRQAGVVWAEIARQTKYASAGAAYNGVKAALGRRALGGKVEDQKLLEEQRFDALQRAYWREALGGDLKAAKFVLQVSKERRQMLGLQGLIAPETLEDPLDELAARRERKSGTD